MSAYSEKIARAKQQGLYKVADLLGMKDKQVTHTISHLLEDTAMFGREIDILCFVDTGKQLQVNITNGEFLINNFGEDPESWAGHPRSPLRRPVRLRGQEAGYHAQAR